MKKDCNLNIKAVSRHHFARSSEKSLNARAEWLEKWVYSGMDYLKNCVFIDESRFDINMRRSRNWAARDPPVVVTSPSAKAVLHTIIGTISAFSIVNISLREAGNVKKRKVVGVTKKKATEDRISVPKGTTSGHYLNFINDTMDIMDEFPEMKGVFIVMNNAPVYVPEIIDLKIKKRGNTPVYLPPCSPEINPIEQFWAVLKGMVKQSFIIFVFYR
jgi:hypothetical protein